MKTEREVWVCDDAPAIDAGDVEQTALYEALKATDPHGDTGDTLYDTWASALWEAGVRAP